MWMLAFSHRADSVEGRRQQLVQAGSLWNLFLWRVDLCHARRVDSWRFLAHRRRPADRTGMAYRSLPA